MASGASCPEELPGQPGARGEEDDDASALGTSDSASSASGSGEDDDVEPEWLHSVQRRGELFYLELDEDADETPRAPVPGRAVRFSEEEVVITEAECARGHAKGPAGLRRFARALRSRRLLPRRAAAPPVSILKAPAGRSAQDPPRRKEVTLHVHPRAPARRRLDALLGIVHRGGRRRPGLLQVQGLQPGGPALKSGQVLIGDILVAVDDVPVTTENIEQVLACIPGPMQVKLTLESPPVSKGATAPADPKKAPTSPAELVQLLGGHPEGDAPPEPHVAMFLSLQLDSDSTKDEQEILYLYPVSDAAQKLKSARGIFLTLCDMLETVTGTPVTSSSLLLEGQHVHVTYCREADKLLVLGLPARRAPLPRLRSMTEAAVRTLRFMFDSLESAFGQAENAVHLDYFFTLFFQRALQPEAQRCGAVLLDSLPGAHWLPLPRDLKVDLDTALSDLEAADFAEMSEDYCDTRRLYTIVGTSLFYKGHLLCSHLPTDDLREVTGYCHHLGLLPLATRRRVGQLVVWREVFRPRPPDAATTEPVQEAEGRCFLLVVGLGHCLLSVLLEAGGCAAEAVDNPGPDCVYVDQAHATLRQLEALEPRISQHLAAGPGPALSCADWLLAGPQESSALSPSTALSRLPGAARAASSPTCRRTLFRDYSAKTRRPSPSRGSGAEEQAGLSPQPTPEAAENSGALAQAPRRKSALPNPFHLAGLKKEPSEKAPELDAVLKLTSGPENTLFHYIAMETVQGVFITPTQEQLTLLGGTMHPQLLRNFHRCCLAIRALFQQALVEGRRASAGGPHSAAAPRGPWLHPVKEHGLLFECSPEDGPRKDPPVLAYWVVGRLFLQPRPQELYVCFHDSATEIAMEMAFKLFFALTL